MGFGSNGPKVLYYLSKMSRSDFIDAARALADNNDVIIYADCNNVIHNVKSRAGDPVEEVAKELLEWAWLGAVIKPIYDGAGRPESKIQSHKSKAIREKKKAEVVIARHLLVNISHKLKTEEFSGAERAILLEQRDKVEKKIRSAENLSTNVLGDDFPQRLQEELHHILVHVSPNGLGGRVC